MPTGDDLPAGRGARPTDALGRKWKQPAVCPVECSDALATRMMYADIRLWYAPARGEVYDCSTLSAAIRSGCGSTGSRQRAANSAAGVFFFFFLGGAQGTPCGSANRADSVPGKPQVGFSAELAACLPTALTSTRSPSWTVECEARVNRA